MTNSFNYLKTALSENRADYPFTGNTQSCAYNAAHGVVSTTGYTDIATNDPDAHIAALENGPISVAVEADSSVFQFYKSGILSSTACGTNLNHAVNIIGYGSDSGTLYWLVRNSWGTSWGEAGYFRVLRDTTSGPGICGILSMSSQPTI